MQRDPGIPEPPTEPVESGEVRWIERLQQRARPAPTPPATRDSAEEKTWINRLLRRADHAL
ncbi:hypothetical protein [Dongia sp.]|uniref:hypothetical protein n=1 Tax=Dongia sp. TaxID=1977262 RepID=UPI003750B7BF